MEKLLFSRKEVASLIGLSLASVEALTKSGQLETVKVGRSVRVHHEALAAFAKQGTNNRTVVGQELHELWRKK